MINSPARRSPVLEAVLNGAHRSYVNFAPSAHPSAGAIRASLVVNYGSSIFGLLARCMSRTDHPRGESMLRTTPLVLPLLLTGHAVADAQTVRHRVKGNGMEMDYEVCG